jgi:hypothetical protein
MKGARPIPTRVANRGEKQGGRAMTYYIVKVLLTAVLVVAVSEVAKKSPFLGALVASVPLVSVLGIVWLFIDTRNIERVARLSTEIFWLVIPSLSLFLVLPIFLRSNIGFFPSLFFSLLVMAGFYLAMYFALHRLGLRA